MRKLVLTISLMAMPLAACGQREETPSEADPVQQVTDSPAPPVVGDTPTPPDSAPDRSAMKPSMNEPQPEPAMPIDEKSTTE